MSYSLTISTTNKRGINGAIIAAGINAGNDVDAEPAVNDHVSHAMDAAILLAETVGREVDDISVNVTGHANPDHAPREGWSNEFITITVSARPLTEPPR